MSRISLVITGLLLLVSFSLQARDQAWHEHRHKNGYHYKHAGGHYYVHRGRHYACKNRKHNGNRRHYRGQAQFFSIPIVKGGTRYGYSVSGQIIVYPTVSLKSGR